MDVDVTKVRAVGPWVLIKPEPPKKTSKGGIYLPDGNLLERLGHLVGTVISASSGYWETPRGKTKMVYVPMEIEPGDRVVFRGHLQEAHLLGKDHCFLHIKDLVGVLEDGAELDLALPHDN
jgi:co-chaperonin GroES (HSP10)